MTPTDPGTAGPRAKRPRVAAVPAALLSKRPCFIRAPDHLLRPTAPPAAAAPAASAAEAPPGPQPRAGDASPAVRALAASHRTASGAAMAASAPLRKRRIASSSSASSVLSLDVPPAASAAAAPTAATATATATATGSPASSASAAAPPSPSPGAAAPAPAADAAATSAAVPIVDPQAYVDRLLRERGYDGTTYCTLESGYYCRPTPHQEASYGIELVRAVRDGDATHLGALLRAGLSRNPCNAFGESIVHMVCRRGRADLLEVLAGLGASLQVSDDFGRTPLHDACWTALPDFAVVDRLLRRDPHLLRMCDCRGVAPLAYVKRDNWSRWVEYLASRADEFWPYRVGAGLRGLAAGAAEDPPPLVGRGPDSCPVPDPPGAASLEMARLVASGRLGPEEARRRRDEWEEVGTSGEKAAAAAAAERGGGAAAAVEPITA